MHGDEPPGSVYSEIMETTYNLLHISLAWTFSKPNIASLVQVKLYGISHSMRTFTSIPMSHCASRHIDCQSFRSKLDMHHYSRPLHVGRAIQSHDLTMHRLCLATDSQEAIWIRLYSLEM